MVATWIIQRCRGCGMNAFNKLRSPKKKKNCFNYFVSNHVDNNGTNTKGGDNVSNEVCNHPPNPVAWARGAQTYRILKFVVGSSRLDSFLNCCHNDSYWIPVTCCGSTFPKNQGGGWEGCLTSYLHHCCRD